MTFEECMQEITKHPELFMQFCRLKGYTLPKSPIEQMIDDSTGYTKEIVQEFVSFCFEYVYLRVPKEEHGI